MSAADICEALIAASTEISFAGITQTIGEQKASGIAASVALLF